jgi:transcriptional regulator with XRE-family HTH domain
MNVVDALHASPLSLRQLADLSGLSHHTLRSYSSGRLVPPPASVERIREALLSGGAECIRIANELDPR